MQIFADRAQRVCPAFALTAETFPVITARCEEPVCVGDCDLGTAERVGATARAAMLTHLSTGWIGRNRHATITFALAEFAAT